MADNKADIELAGMVAEYYADPLGYVKAMFPWGSGDLATAKGPDTWQTAALKQIGDEVKSRRFDGTTPVAPLRFARASGHDIGKTTLAAWLVCWISDTRPDSQGTVTANTATQLETKTWAAIKKWRRLSLTRDWWVMGATLAYHRDPGKRETWFLGCASSNEENSEAFAGQHAATSTSYYVFDEASAIPDEIWRVAEGGLTDGEPMLFAFGNPTRNAGMFFDCCFGGRRHRWNHGSIDSRDSGISNKTTIAEWLEDYGEDSDFFRVRVRGLPPKTAEDQLIGRELVEGAGRRHVYALADEPLVCGVDVSGGGAAWNVVRFRRGLDARSIPPIRIPGAKTDRAVLVARLADLLRNEHPERKISAMFVDSAFGSPIVERLHTLGFDQVHEVNFGGKSPDMHFANFRAWMWGKQMRGWLERGGIDRSDTKLAYDLMAPGFHLNRGNALCLESKEEMQKRGIASPDDGDALALTFAAAVGPVVAQQPPGGYSYQQRAAASRDAWMM